MEWAEYRRNGNRSDVPGSARWGLLQCGYNRRGQHRRTHAHPGDAKLDKVHVEYCPAYMLKDWEREIPGLRAGMEDATEDPPGLTSQFSSMFRAAWRKARRKAVLELAEYDVEHKLMPDDRQARKRRRLTLPAECPYRFEHVTGISFKRGDNKPHYDDSVLPPQVQRILDERTRNSPDFDR